MAPPMAIFESHGDLENGESSESTNRANGSSERWKRTWTEIGETSEKVNTRSIDSYCSDVALHKAAQLAIDDSAAFIPAGPRTTRRSARQSHARTLTATSDALNSCPPLQLDVFSHTYARRCLQPQAQPW